MTDQSPVASSTSPPIVASPTVGRIVHYFTNVPASQANGVGVGPYAAVVTQKGENFINLKVLQPFKDPFDAGSVPHRRNADLESPYAIWWDWPELSA